MTTTAVRTAGAAALTLFGLLMADSAAAQRPGGDTVVVNATTPMLPSVATLVPVLTLNPEANGGRPLTVPLLANARDGGVIVIDLSDPSGVGGFDSRVMLYDRSGNLTQSFGRNGEGPGEYVFGIGDAVQLPDNRVVLSDSRGLLEYAANGAPLSRVRVPSYVANIGPRVHAHPDGSVLVWAADTQGARVLNDNRSAAAKEHVLLKVSSDFQRVDTLPTPVESLPKPTYAGAAQLPYSPTPLWAWSPLGYFVTAHADDYRFELRKPRSAGGMLQTGAWATGDPVVSIRRDVAAIAISPAERREWIESIRNYNRRAAASRFPPPGAARSWDWSLPEVPIFPRTKSPVQRLIVAADGRIWVRVAQPSVLDSTIGLPASFSDSRVLVLPVRPRWIQPQAYDVYESTGQYVGQVAFPSTIRDLPFHTSQRMAISGDTVWAVVTDSLDVASVVQYRVVWN